MSYQRNMTSTAPLVSVIIPAYNNAPARKIKELDLGDRVEVVNEVVDTSKSISESHIIVIPFLNTHRSPEIPLSPIESLACGRPVVASDVAEIADIVERYTCGCVSKPDKIDFTSGLKRCKENYQLYQVNCHKAVQKHFILNVRKFETLAKQ